MKTLDLSSMREKASEAEQLLNLLANRHRLLVMCQLVEGERSVGQLQENSGLSQSALSQHLAKLREAGLVTARRDGQSIYYSISSKEAEALLGTLYDLYCGPDTDSQSKPLRE